MNTKRLLIGWMILMFVLTVAGCRPAPTPVATEEPAFGPAFARDAALASIWTESTPPSDLQWNTEDLTPQDLLGSSTMRYTSGAWVVVVTYPIVAPDATIYQVEITNTAGGLAWNGTVDAQGKVGEITDGNANLPNPASVYCQERGGKVEIRTGADGGQVGICVFADGSECDEWAFFRGECAPGGAIPPDVVLDREAAYGEVRFLYNQDIAAEVTGETVAAEELWEVIPEHIAFSFNGYVLPSTFHEAHIYVYPVGEFADGGRAATTAVALRSLLDGGQLTPPGGGFEGAPIPVLPLFNAGQLLRTQVAFVTFQNGQGVRFLTEYAQYNAPINNTDLFYTFQGLTDDGKYYVAAILPVAHPSLPADAAQIPGGDPDAFASNYETYANEMALQLAAYGAAEFTPGLALLDALIASLQVTP